MSKEQRFKKVLESAKEALDSINITFHLHSGTALGAHREKTFIKHDGDIDLSVFHQDVDKASDVKKIIKSMENEGFTLTDELGTIKRGKELKFEKSNVPLDIFWTYKGEYRGKKYHLVASYFGNCDNLKYKICMWGYRPYKTQKIRFLGKSYNTVPRTTLEDMYGSDWKIVKKFNYYEGIESGGYKGLIKDYFAPKKVDTRIAFCFLTYDSIKHRTVWEKFFNQDDYPVKSYNIYSHVKKVTKDTPDWIKNAKVKTVKTEWCEMGLVNAWISMLKKAIKDKTNKYFCLLSGECIPLFKFWETYTKIKRSKKSRMLVDTHIDDFNGLYKSDQWVILNRKCARILIELITTQKGKNFIKESKKNLCEDDICFCPDEIYPVNWFTHIFGSPSTKRFKANIINKESTYTYWVKPPHPVKFTYPRMIKMKKEICQAGAVFGRKFNSKAAKGIAMNCGK